MAIIIQKLLAPKNSIIISILCILFLVTKVKSDFSFNYPNFLPETVSINNDPLGVANDATITNGVIELTRKDKSGNPLQHSVGQAGLVKPIRIYNKKSGKIANFVTEFTFRVKTNGKRVYGDGFAFFITSPEFKIPDRTKSEGGFLGMFTHETAFKKSNNNNKNKNVLLVEFDSFANEWDPNPVSQYSHIGIDVNSIKSVAVGTWYSDFELDEPVGKARVEYNSGTKILSVLVTYGNKVGSFNGESSLIHKIDLTSVLPEMVQIGFSAATGELVETHDILSWSFSSNM